MIFGTEIKGYKNTLDLHQESSKMSRTDKKLKQSASSVDTKFKSSLKGIILF